MNPILTTLIIRRRRRIQWTHILSLCVCIYVEYSFYNIDVIHFIDDDNNDQHSGNEKQKPISSLIENEFFVSCSCI